MRNKNIEAIKSNIGAFGSDIIERLENCENNNSSDNIDIEIIDTKTKLLTGKVLKEGKQILLHSMYDPKKEAYMLAKEIENKDNLDLVFIIGGGAGYLIQAVREIKYDVKIALVEPSLSFFNTMINSFYLAKIFSDKNTFFFIGEDEIKDIETFISVSTTKSVQILATRSYLNIYGNDISTLQKYILDIVDKKTININTLTRFEKVWAYNIAGNVLSILFNYGINKFFDLYSDMPAVIISAGPSLEKNIDKLHEMKKRAVLIAVDTAVKPLISHGIEPHFIVTIDPQKKNAKYLRFINTKTSVLISESSIDGEVLDNYNGRIYFIDSVFPLAKYFMSFLGERGDINMGGSVSTAAFDLAIKFGCKKIIMIGLDLSFPNHQTHIKGSYHEEDFFTQISKLDSYDSRIYKVLVSGNLVKEKNIYGDDVFIDSRFQMYRNWYEKECLNNSDIEFINATEGGVVIKAMRNDTLDNLITELPELDINTSILGDDIDEDKKQEVLNNFYIGLKKIDEDIVAITPLPEEGIKLSIELENLIKHHKDISKVVSRLNEIDAKLLNITSVNKFISITMQKTIKMLTEGFDLDDSVEKEYMAARNALKFYEAMLDSIKFNHYIIARALKRIESTLI